MMHIDAVNPIVENSVTQYLRKYFAWTKRSSSKAT